MSSKLIDMANATAQTTDATQTTVLTYTHPASSVGDYTVQIMGMDSSGSNAAFLDQVFGVKSDGSTTAIVGSVLNLVSNRATLGAALWSASVSVSGSDINIAVTGASATTIDWFVVLRASIYTP